MIEVSAPVMAIDEDVELDLGLSIGGSFRRSEKTKKPVEISSGRRRIGSGFDLDLRDDDVASDAVDSKKQRAKRCRSGSHASESENGQRRPVKREKTEGIAPVNRFVPVQYPHAQVQYVPYTRGLAYPCVNMIPYWTPSFPVAQKSAFRSVSCGGLRPFLAHPSFGLDVSQKNGEIVSVSKTTSNQCSPMCSNSTVSDQQSSSSSLEVDGSSDTRTQNSSQSSREQTNQKEKHYTKLQSDAQSTCNKNSTTKNNETKKPPRHEGRAKTLPPTVFPEMPYVAARGDGPAGRTVTGLLYRYSNDAEITIVCVCHGTTFSPAEFVKHAGGTDVSQPLRHITVIPNPPL